MDRSDREMAELIARRVAELGGRTYFVGGYVRDGIMGRENKDVDIEVHGITPRQLCGILDSLGHRIDMGASFGIFGLKGCDLDIAMPRRERLMGRGHRDFDVEVDPFLGEKKAAQRRDFTMNALMQDVLTGEIADYFGGLDDIRGGIVRHVNEDTFSEDPLRVLRAAQFAARFEFDIAEETLALTKTMDLSALASERIWGELKKALLKAERPSIFFEEMRRMEQLDVWFPEMKMLIGIEQSPLHHPEGDVWTHTMLVLNEAAKLRDKAQNPIGFMLSALMHDFGKVLTTEIADGKIRSYKHETEGLGMVRRAMERIMNEKKQINYVANMTELHMKPNMLAAQNAGIKATNRMFDKAESPHDLILLARADDLGRGGERGADADKEEYLEKRLALYEDVMSKPYVMGADLIEAGLKPDKSFAELLAFAHTLRLAGVETKAALSHTLAMARRMTGE